MLPPPDPVVVKPGEPIRFPPGTRLITVSGEVASDERRTVLLQTLADHQYTMTLGGDMGLWLDAGFGEEVANLPGRSPRRVTFVPPETGVWSIDVVSKAGEVASFELTTLVRPLNLGPLPTGPVVHLTFDDGPHPVYTAQVLDVLRRHGARATFFVVGWMAYRFPELVDRIILEGHTVANHTWNHENLTTLSHNAIDRTLQRTQDLLGPNATPCMRPPYGAMNAAARRVAAEQRLDVVMWNSTAADWLDLSAETMAERILMGAVDGGIILMHDGGGDRSRTVSALEMALGELSDRSMTFEPICDN